MVALLRTFNHYRSVTYVGAILIILLQFYVIWQDRLDYVSLVEYSYRVGGERQVDRNVFDGRIYKLSQLVNAEVKLKEKYPTREDILVRSILVLSKDKETKIYWGTE